MSNSFVANLIPRLLPKTLEVLREQLPLLSAVQKDYDNCAAALGDTVTIQKSVPLTIGDVSPAMIAPSPQDIAPGFTTVSISNWKKASFGLTTKEIHEIIAGNQIPYQVEEAIRTVCRYVSQSMWAGYTSVSNLAGKCGTGCVASNSLAYVSDAAHKLDLSFAPGGNRQLVMSLKDAADLRTNTAYGTFLSSGEQGAANVLRAASTDNIFKSLYDFKSVTQDATVPIHTVGTFGGGTVAASGTNAANSTSILVAVTGGTGFALKAGDVVVIGTETYPARNTYSLTADATIGAGTTGTLYLNRGLSTAKSSSEAVTLATTDGSNALASSIVNLAGDMSGIAVVARIPEADMMGLPRTMYESFAITDPVTGFPLTLTHLSGYHMSAFEISALWGTAMVDERKLCRLHSYTSY